MSHALVMGTTRFSPGFKVNRTAIAPARFSPLLTHRRLLFDKRPSLENGVHTSLPLVGSKVVVSVLSTPGDLIEAIAHWPSKSSCTSECGRVRSKTMPLTRFP